MKKQIALATAAAMVLGLAACGSKPAETKPAETAAQGRLEAVTEAEAKRNRAEGRLRVLRRRSPLNWRIIIRRMEHRYLGDTKFAELVNEYTGGNRGRGDFPQWYAGRRGILADMLEADTLILPVSVPMISPSCTHSMCSVLPYVFPSDEIKYKALDGDSRR